MGSKEKICVIFFLFVAVLLVSAGGSGETDPQYRDCKFSCEKSEAAGADEGEKLRCKKRCEEYHHEKQRREREGRGGEGRSYGGGGSSMIFMEKEQGVRKMVAECHQSCQGSQGEQQRPQCFKSCMQKRFERHQSGDRSRPEISRRTETDTQRHQQSNNPYVFEDHHFTARVEAEHGMAKVLQKFTDRSELFQGIENYRVAFFEAEPQTFVVPTHWDADALIFVAGGKGKVTLIEGDSRRSHHIKRGDLFRVRAGITVYLINTDDNERLVLVKILHSVSVPGELQFFSVGGGNPESSFYYTFSHEVFEAAFGIDPESDPKLFRRQKEQGMFKKATEEQIRSLAGEDKGRLWPFGDRKEQATHSIYENEPSVANENGILHEISSKDFPYLRDINVAFSFFNITQGSMAGPFYNTKATLVLIVSNGNGRFEMACPHLSEQTTRGVGEINPRYEKVSAELRRGTVVVIPAGHPLVIEASGEQNLEVIGFGLNSDENEWFPLAGRNNVMSQLEDVALELTFGFSAEELKRVIHKQHQKLFFKGPVRSGRAFA